MEFGASVQPRVASTATPENGSMLPQTFWRQIEGVVLDGRIRVGSLLRPEREGLFAAEPLDESTFGGARNLAVRLIRATSEPVLDRYLEASFLDHSNLLRCFGAGTVQLAGTDFIYCVLERAEVTLADLESERPLSAEEAKELGAQLIVALRYLHDRDLIYCNLDPTTVVRAGDVWKLSEYSQLRVVGRGYASETRRMLALSAGTPPEAWDGTVSAAWDAWSLAWLLAGAVSERRPAPRDTAAVRSSSRRPLPPPFAAVISECLNADPTQRCGLDGIEALLRQPSPPPAPIREPVPPPVRPAEPALRVLNPKQAIWATAILATIFILLATLVQRAHRAPRSVVAARPAQQVTVPVRQVAETVQRSGGDADRVIREDPNSPNGLVQQWAEAIRTRNLDTQVACYAPRVYAFYGDAELTPKDIRRRRAIAMDRYDEVRRLDISNLEIQMKSPTSAAATFDERWDVRGASPSAGKIQERLGMHKVGGHWRITSESNLRTYFKNGPNPQS